jgi:TPR repeat protein
MVAVREMCSAEAVLCAGVTARRSSIIRPWLRAMAVAVGILSGGMPALSYGQSQSTHRGLSSELVAKAEAGDVDAQFATAYLVLVRNLTDTTIPAVSDEKRAQATAVRYLQQAVDKGMADAEHLLGTAYLSGIAVAKDETHAKELFRLAAVAGNADGENALGQMLSKGQGGVQDDAAAAEWFEKAVAQGYKPAMVNLGFLYVQGRGVAKDEKKAADLMRTAAEGGLPEAQHNLGWMYANGKGVAKDMAEALRWYTAAAEQGYEPSQLNVGFIYAKGEAGGDVRGQLVAAVKWFALASLSDNATTSTTARKAIVYIAERQAPDIVTDGFSEAKKWGWAH